MEHFLINSSVCMFVLWLVYKLLLENISWHVFKRVYLLGAIIVSVVIPFLVVKTVVIPAQELPVLEYQNSIAPQQVTQVTAETDFAIDWFYVALGVYLLGVCIMLFRFTKNLIAFKIQKNDEVSSYARYLLILRGEVTVPHSFWNRIFVSKKQYEQDLIPTVVLEHEKTHLDQKHSLDVLLVELLLVMFWFNPVLYMLRYAIKLNHEFLADQAVLKTGIPTKDYQELILNHATSQYQHAMANTFHFPLIKKRFNIMKTKTSHTNLFLRSLALIPVLALLIISCGKEEVVIAPENMEIIEITEQESSIEILGATIQEITEYNALAKKFKTPNGKSLKFSINDETLKMQSLYQSMTEKQKNTAEPYPYTFEVKEIIEAEESSLPIVLINNLSSRDISEYNKLAKKHKAYLNKNRKITVWKDETTRMQSIFYSMNKKQRSQNEPWPYSGIHYGVEYKAGEVPPPPPAPMTAIEYIKANKADLNYYLNDNKISAETAIQIIKQLGQNGVEISTDASGKSSIKIKETAANKSTIAPPPPLKEK